MATVFVNYRTGDGEDAAAHIDDDLSRRFGSRHVFFAAKSIGLGTRFPERLDSALHTCKVLLCVIGERWSTSTDRSGQRLIDRSDDWVRREIATALRRGVIVIPVLRRETRLSKEELPEDIADIAELQYQRLFTRSWRRDMAELADRIAAAVPELRPTPGLPLLGTFPAVPDQAWQCGMEVAIGGRPYLLVEPVEDTPSSDRRWVARSASAESLEPLSISFSLRQLRILRPCPAGEARRDALVAEGELLRSLAGKPGIPRLHELIDTPTEASLVFQRPALPSLADLYGPTETRLPLFLLGRCLRLIASLCTTLVPLHQRGHGHRDLAPTSILLLAEEERSGLRDLGLATLPITAGEGRPDYRAPEQRRGSTADRSQSPQIDVYQIAAITYHILTGHTYSPDRSPPVRIITPELPTTLEELLCAALHVDPRNRPRNAQALGAHLNTVISELDRGDSR
ncbi:TIR domain-containing protein [Allokutzneria sp. A3M-2-11 16]|uniref:protein kinase domain-containing protein n=1 Tax=Allokutzneria sp. A3M-2-11 16 TaxID=2962043 RepID=UPI0020B73EEA|nr:TIR domain-containing protein [Allokutzneria sp. A3M-2-11 16]MCP3802076.1 TIR domain-containing protein [Allokutzneria sp. A3M-2-11 16]